MRIRRLALLLFFAGVCFAETNDVDVVPTNSVDEVRAEFLAFAGIEYTEEGELEEAERAYLRALEMDPDNPDIRFRLGTLYVKMGQEEKAIPQFEALIEEFPNNPSARNNLAWTYATAPGIKNTQKALLHIREALLSEPNNASLWNTLAEVYFVAGDYDRAERSAEHALDLLSETRPSEESLQSFQAQIIKIERAREARNLLERIQDEE